MKKWIVLIFIVNLVNTVSAQQRITLQECFESAIINHPLYAQKTLKKESSALQIEGFKKDLLPQIYMNGKVSYQNEVISLPINIPGLDIPELSKDQYRLSLDINQVIYRGGIYQKQKEMENMNSILDQLEVDKNLYYIKKDVKSLFFSIILLDEQNLIVKSYGEQISSKMKELKAMVEEGASIPSILDGLQAEKLNIDQQLTDIKIQRKALITNLELLTNRDLSGVKELVISPVNIETTQQQRIEYKMMTSNQDKLEFSKQLIDVKKLPMVSAFASGGYGRPGFNYLSNDFDSFLMVGINFKWNILNWNKFNNQKKILDLNIQVIETQKKDFNLNIQVALNQLRSEVKKYQNQLNNDPEMIRLRQNVADNASHQLSQGLITSSAYIDDLEKLSQAKINMKIHEIQLINYKLDYLNILGKL